MVTCIEGYQMARKVRSGATLGMSAIASIVSATFGVVAIIMEGLPLASVSIAFSGPEFLGLMAMGL